MSVFPFTIAGSDGLPIRGDVHVPNGDGPHPVVVGIHGFKGFRNWGFWPHIAQGLADAGIACIRFDLSHNGVGENGEVFDEKDLFEANTMTREEEDVAAVIDALRSGALPGCEHVDSKRLGLIGHSRGGGQVLLRAAKDEGILAAVTLAAIGGVLRFPADALEKGRADGFIPIVNTRTGEVLRFGSAAIAELGAREDLHDIAASHAARVHVPLLVCQGTADPAIAVDEARAIAAAAPHATLELFEGADHVLDCRHPWQGPTPHFERFVRLAAEHFSRIL